MVDRILLLAPQLANQIAAGEVVERPASVVKECVENSIDAGAKKIIITLEQGGLQRIRVQDDGVGIHADDLMLAVSRHATSKIHEAADLQQIDSLGFRGEALASIASVSQLSLTSRTVDSDCAWQIRVDDMARCTKPEPAAHPQGTTVDIQSLFYNTPARRKFLRSERTEALQVQEIVKRLALSHFNVAMTLQMDERLVYQLPAITRPEQQLQRVAKICGKNFLQQAIEMDVTASGLRLWGWLGMPEMTRSQADGQYFFINGRIVRDKLIQHALRQVYQEVVYPGRYPLYVLYLECDPKEIDVNVHPTKHEVRFHNVRLVHDFITQRLTPIILNQPQKNDFLAPTVAPLSTSSVSSVSMSSPTFTHAATLPTAPTHAALPTKPTAASATYDYFPAHFTRASTASCEETAAVTRITQAAQCIVPQYFIGQRYGVIVTDAVLMVIDAQRLLQEAGLAAGLANQPLKYTPSTTWQNLWQQLGWSPADKQTAEAVPAGVKIFDHSSLEKLFTFVPEPTS